MQIAPLVSKRICGTGGDSPLRDGSRFSGDEQSAHFGPYAVVQLAETTS